MKLYRIYNYATANQVYVYIFTFSVVKETHCFYLLEIGQAKLKRVGKSGKKRFAYPSIEEATTSFKARKQRQIGILESQLEQAKRALETDPSKYINEPL